ncbi:MAG: MFS transporter, partial [Bacteroidetes bacterium]|nr:MFS transporter [Bacteroidota bacterium]MBT7491316.1 MFS transporter [Bacteroidota bacterium]
MKNSSKFEYGKVVVVTVSHFVHDIYSSFLAPILPLLIEKLSLSYSYAGLLQVAQRLPMVFNPFIGMLADKVSMRYFVIVTPAITCIVMSFLGLASNFAILAILLFIAGLSAAFYHVPSPVMIKKVSGNETGKGMSFYMIGGELARTFGPLLILGGISIWGLNGTYKLIPFGIAASIFLFFQLRKIEVSTHINSSFKYSEALKLLKKHAAFFGLITAIIFFSSAMKLCLTLFLPTYLTSMGSSLWIAGISLSVLQFSGAGGTLISGIVSDKIGRKNMLIIIYLLNPLLMWLFIYANSILMIPILILLGISMFAPTPVFLAFVQDIKTERPAFMNSIFMTITFVIGTISVMLVGFLSDKFG